MKPSYNLFFALGAVLSCLYFVFPNPLTKPIVIWTLSCLSFLQKHDYGFYVGMGLIFSSFGDILLEISESDKLFFIGGLVNFLIAHIFYIVGFLKTDISYKNAIPISLILLVFYGILMSLLIPNAEFELKVPILFYGIIICTMAFLSFNRYFSDNEKTYVLPRLYAFIGSTIFVVSDTLLALNKFYHPIINAKTLVMITYYFAQTFIGASTHFKKSSQKSK